MPLRPSRRLPKAFQRRASAHNLQLAKSLFSGKNRKKTSASALNRHWRRLQRSVAFSLRHVRLWSACLAISTIIALTVFFFLSPIFSVQTIQIRRQDARIDIEEVQRLLLPFFDHHLLFLATHRLEKLLLDSYSEVDEVFVHKNFPGELRVTLSMDAIDATVTLGDPDAVDAEAPFLEQTLPEITEKEGAHRYLTHDGVYLEYPFSIAPSESDPERFHMHIIDWAEKPTHRQRLLTREALETIRTAERIIEESFGHSVPGVTYYLRAREFHLHTERVVLWLDLSSPITAQIDRYRQFLQTMPLEDVQQYIDLRLQDRVVYR